MFFTKRVTPKVPNKVAQFFGETPTENYVYPYLMGTNKDGKREIVTPPDLDIIRNLADASREARRAFRMWPDLAEVELLGSNLADASVGFPIRCIFKRGADA